MAPVQRRKDSFEDRGLRPVDDKAPRRSEPEPGSEVLCDRCSPSALRALPRP
jgi:hypothetical protein